MLFAVTESGINESVSDGELVPSGYVIHRCDRADGRKHGGVLLAVAPRGGIELRRIPMPDNVDLNVHAFVGGSRWGTSLFNKRLQPNPSSTTSTPI